MTTVQARRSRGRRALAVCGALAAATACVSQDAPADARPRRADFHALCPLHVAHPSVVPVLTAQRWGELLRAARSVPPPYDESATDFGRETVVIVALATTPTPMTKAALAAERPAVFDRRSGELTLRLAVETTPLAPGRAGATVVGEPCLVAWVPANAGLRGVVATTTTGQTIARWPSTGR